MFTSLVVCSIIGIVVLGSGNNTSSVQVEDTSTEKYSKEWVRENLSIRHYDNFEIDDIVYQLKDNWIRQDVERLMRQGLSFEYSIDELVNKKVIKL